MPVVFPCRLNLPCAAGPAHQGLRAVRPCANDLGLDLCNVTGGLCHAHKMHGFLYNLCPSHGVAGDISGTLRKACFVCAQYTFWYAV